MNGSGALPIARKAAQIKGMYKPCVSEHALFRYAQRTGKLDLKAIEREMLSPTVISACKAGAKSVKVNGLTFILDRGLVITVHPTKHKKRQ